MKHTSHYQGLVGGAGVSNINSGDRLTLKGSGGREEGKESVCVWETDFISFIPQKLLSRVIETETARDTATLINFFSNLQMALTLTADIFCCCGY